MIKIGKKNERVTLTLGIAGLIALPVTWLFAYLWVQLGINALIYETTSIATINLFYGIIGVILWIAGLAASLFNHQFAGTVLSIWGIGLLLIVLIYYTWTL